jgi:hypothetical protein
LRGVLTFGLDGDGVAPEGVELALGEGLLVEFAALCRRRNRVEDTGVGDTGFGVVGDELVAVGRNTNAGVTRPEVHQTPPRDRRRIVAGPS